MDRTFARRLAVLLLVLLAGLVFAPTCRDGRPEQTDARPVPTVPRRDAPLFLVPAESLAFKTPEPAEAAEDERTLPYTLRLTLLSFPALEPLDAPIERVEVRGATSARRLGPGVYLFERISVGVTAALLRDAAPDALRLEMQRPKHHVLAERNPVPLARYAITTCELLVPDEEELARKIPVRGQVFDLETGAPLAEASVAVAGRVATTGATGHFELAEAVTVGELVTDAVVTRAGYRGFATSVRSLNLPWARHLKETGEVLFTLIPTAPAGLTQPRLPRLNF